MAQGEGNKIPQFLNKRNPGENAERSTAASLTQVLAEAQNTEDTQKQFVRAATLNVFNDALQRLGCRTVWTLDDYRLFLHVTACMDRIVPSAGNFAPQRPPAVTGHAVDFDDLKRQMDDPNLPHEIG